MTEPTGIEKWRALDGDKTLALDWPLNEYSHVWEIGGFEGRWAQQIWDKFHCHLTIFEPQPWAVYKLLKRFEGLDKIEIRDYGLHIEDTWMDIGGFETDGAGVFSLHEPVQQVQFRDVFQEMKNFPFPIDMALMNIEGMEFILLPEMIARGWMEKFTYFWCQFHPGLVQDGHTKAQKIFWGMEHTHEELWNCYPTAVAWKRR